MQSCGLQERDLHCKVSSFAKQVCADGLPSSRPSAELGLQPACGGYRLAPEGLIVE